MTDSFENTQNSTGKDCEQPREIPTNNQHENTNTLMADAAAPTISKRQLKKQKKQEKYLEKKEYMRSKRKEERKAKREQRVEAGLPARPKKRKIEQESSGVRVVLDLSFEKYMMEKEIKSTAAQVMYCYSDNRSREKALSLYMTSIEQHKDHFTKVPNSFYGLGGDEQPQFCYLTADSPNVITELDPKVIYIVGGIVDKNRHKGLCFQEAEKCKISHGRLPIGEYIKLGTRKVLTINHVAIMGEYVNNKDWKEAFLKVLPARKGAQAKECVNKDQSERDENSDGSDAGEIEEA
ncbi:tRNA methyltransferase 10 [Boothiomyces macroporosus]|uniref:tRNA (guanine(9)-N1)-methyltransferase n=1 Tax=Boothiomyces macroporosus TaxID=261099 RepID=A0AAD5UKJ8_9FUNG|nr:tRNA methyltransferase 10 [Boothiomyces macroporosus]